MVTRKTARVKGKSAEKFIADVFTEHTGIQFRRTPSSGALRNIISKNSSDGQKNFYSSDIQCDTDYAKFFKFAVESKNTKDINYYGILIGQNATFDNNWKQVTEEVCSSDIFPILCLKSNNRKPIVFTTFKGTTDWYTCILHYRNPDTGSTEDIYCGTLESLAKEISIEFNKEKLDG
jgi:hypothetical protein